MLNFMDLARSGDQVIGVHSRIHRRVIEILLEDQPASQHYELSTALVVSTCWCMASGKEYALPTSDLKARPIVGVGVRAIIRGQFLSAELNDLLSLHCIKTIGSPAYSNELTSAPCHVCAGEDFRAFRQVID